MTSWPQYALRVEALQKADSRLAANPDDVEAHFDRGRLRPPGAWKLRNVKRLHRSLAKVSRGLPADRFSALTWEWFLAGYAAVPEGEA